MENSKHLYNYTTLNIWRQRFWITYYVYARRNRQSVKMPMILKLLKELQRDIFPTVEERQAFKQNIGYVIEQNLFAKKLASA